MISLYNLLNAEKKTNIYCTDAEVLGQKLNKIENRCLAYKLVLNYTKTFNF